MADNELEKILEMENPRRNVMGTYFRDCECEYLQFIRPNYSAKPSQSLFTVFAWIGCLTEGKLHKVNNVIGTV